MNKLVFAFTFCLVMSTTVLWADDLQSTTSKWLLDVPKPKAVDPPSDEMIQASIDRGLDFLIRHQNENGSWGSATNTKGLNIYAPIPGAHHAFRAAVTGLCLSALIESGDRRVEIVEAIEKAERWNEEWLPKVRRAEPTAIYNVWAHAYAIRGLVDLHAFHKEKPRRQERIIQLIRQQADRLERYEGIDGGWGYYDFGAQTQKPNVEPTSFTTATVLIALHEAKQLGVDFPERQIKRAVNSLIRQQKPDFSYYYSDNGPTKNRPMWLINRPGGSLGRSQACNLALKIWGSDKITDQVIEAWLDRLFSRNLWLDIGRKRPIPHESHFLVAGYFFYYGHFYAAGCIEMLPEKSRPPHKAQLSTIILRLQEKDGSWWDYPFYNYHQQYGTAMSIMTLLGCQSEPRPGVGFSLFSD
ncbi:MAG: terpene cyclase/mutase family protein [Pirellulaceae bacterium]|nr:terpene cyclase/mutase family protein [Pirellulaceae bacterium]